MNQTNCTILKAHFSKRHFIFPFVFASVCHQKQMRYNNICCCGWNAIDSSLEPTQNPLLLFASHRLPPFSPNQWPEKWHWVITATVSVTDSVSSEWHVLPDANLWRVADAERCEASSEAPDWDDYWWNDIISNSRIFTPDVRAVPSVLSSYIFTGSMQVREKKLAALFIPY